jgi:hypothetical protein
MNLGHCTPRVAARQRDGLYEIDCPFCEQIHVHGNLLGHRNSHCASYIPARLQKVDPRDAKPNSGYVLCDPSDAVNWDAERLIGALYVLRQKYRRLMAEYAAMDPLGAREKRVQATTKAQAEAIAYVLTAGGVAL